MWWLGINISEDFNPEDGISPISRNTGIQPPHYTMQQPRKFIAMTLESISNAFIY
jgi:hypothetical protein